MSPLSFVSFRCLRTRDVARKLIFAVSLIVIFTGLAPGIAMAQELLTLKESILIAKQFNPGFAVEEQNIRKQAIDIQKAQADTRPVVSYTSDYEQLFGVQTLKNSVDLSWDLSRLAKNAEASQTLKLKAAEQHKTMFESQLVYLVKAGYYKLMQLKQELTVLQKNHQLLRQQRAVTEQLVAAQLKLQSALSRIDDRINMLKNQILVKQGDVEAARTDLLQLMNHPDPANVKFADCKKEFPATPERPQAMAQSLEKTPELRRMILERQSLERSVHRPWVDMLPVISVSTEYQQEWPQGHEGAGVHLVFTFPLLDMGRANAVNAGNAALAAKKRAEIRQKNKTIIDRLTTLFDKAERSKTLYNAYKETCSHRQQTLQLIREEYQSGLISESDLINTQREASDAELRMNGVFYEYMTLIAEISYRQGAVE